MIRRFVTCLLLTYLGASLAHAEKPGRYEVEVVVFRNLDVPGIDSELWQAQFLQPVTNDAIPITRLAALQDTDIQLGTNESTTDFVPRGFEKLPEPAYRLSRQAAALNRSRRYELLLHAAWRQPGLNRRQAVALRLIAGQPFRANPPSRPLRADSNALTTIAPPHIDGAAQPLNQNQNQDAATAEPVAAGVGSETAQSADLMTVYPLDGVIRVVKERYLHIYTDLIYSHVSEAPASGTLSAVGQMPRANDSTPRSSVMHTRFGIIGQSYRLRQHRRLRSKELHYLDHPKLGLLVMITPR